MLRWITVLAAITLVAVATWGSILILGPTVMPFVSGLGGTANVPACINHQGVVTVSGLRFTGTGQFRFAIIDVDAGLNLWTNDGTQLGTSNAPDDAVSLTVTDGIYTVNLGNTALTHMTAVPASIFSNGKTSLRVWFNDGVNGWQQLSPDHALTSTPYAFRAETVSPGSIGSTQLATGAVATANLANGAVSSEKLASAIGVWNASGSNVTYTAGNVGIGVSSPQHKLAVNGAVNVSGAVDISGAVTASSLAGGWVNRNQNGSGYVDLGNVRLMWGTVSRAPSGWQNAISLAYAGPFNITLPAAFADTTYVVTATCSDSSVANRSAYVSYVGGLTTTTIGTIYLSAPDPGETDLTSFLINYWAIGSKP